MTDSDEMNNDTGGGWRVSNARLKDPITYATHQDALQDVRRVCKLLLHNASILAYDVDENTTEILTDFVNIPNCVIYTIRRTR
jgi:hypothetical protein